MQTPADSAALPGYAELHCLSNFTFLRGASHPEEMVLQAAVLGYSALALTDECSVAGVVRAHMVAREHGLKLIVGSEIRLADGPTLILLAADRTGYGNLSELITRGRRRAEKGAYTLYREDLAEGLPGCLALLIPKQDFETAALRADAVWLGAGFPNAAWIAFERLHGAGDRERFARLRALADQSGLPLAAAGDVHMHERGRRPLQDLLTAIRLGTPLHRAGQALYPNGERHLRSRRRLARLYPAELLGETLRIAERCTFSLDELRYEYPSDLVPPGLTPAQYLRQLTEAGARERWPEGIPAKVRALIEHELAIIDALHYEPYFLTVHDIVRFARSRGILCQGRGSAANSVVCYCLKITSVDPSRMEMLFERFVSKERNEPPDIDVDFEHARREEVIQYLYTRYGRERAAIAATVITYRPKSAIRDAGKALGMSLEQVDRLAGAFSWWDGQRIAPERLREAGFDPDNPVLQRLMVLVGELLGFPRHLSQHVGGFVIARDKVSRLVPVENAAMAERTVIQWDKDDLDAMGLLKVDCLALGMLTAIHKAFDLVKKHRGYSLSLASVPAEDPAVYRMIQKADTIGVFQIESRAQMSMLPRLKPANFYDLVIEVAIVRPGPIQGDMVHPYLLRRQGLQPVSYPSEEVREVLERTLGVPIFQEQVIKLAMVAAGFSAGEADGLRRAIASWRRKDKLARFQQRMIEGMRERGYAEEFARQIYGQILGFGEYGFPESHSASFALLVYVSAWLKYHEPACFTCALLNSQPMGFYAPAQLVQDAKNHGVEIRPVDVLHSDWDCTLEGYELRVAGCGSKSKGEETDVSSNSQPETRNPQRHALRLGMRLVKGMTGAGAQRIERARQEAAFTSVADLSRRAGLTRRELDALAAAGALASLAGNRHQARWEALGRETPAPLFQESRHPEAVAMLPSPTEAQDIVADYGSLGLTLGRHPLALLRDRLTAKRCLTTAQALGTAHGRSVRLAGLVITRQHPSTAKGVIFLTLEDESGVINIIVWPNLVDRYRKEVLSARLVVVDGELQREGEVVHVVARRLEDNSPMLGGLDAPSRDFR